MRPLVTHEKLPNVVLPQLGLVDLKCTERIGRVKGCPLIALLRDGGVGLLSETDQMNMAAMSGILNKMPARRAIQIYELRKEEGTGTWIYQSQQFDYARLRVKWLESYRKIFTGAYELKKALQRETQEAVETLRLDEGMVGIEWGGCELKDIMARGTGRVSSNLSCLKIGETSYATLFSVSNIDTLGMKRIEWPKKHLKVISVIRPSKVRESELKNEALKNLKVLNILRPEQAEAGNRIRVHTIVGDSDALAAKFMAGIRYASVSYMLIDETLDELERQASDFEDAAKDMGLDLYHHMSTARQQYLSLMPGQAATGEHWTTVNAQVLPMVMHRMLSL